jgi:hypothetical protein
MPATIRLPKENGNSSRSILVDTSSSGLSTIDVDSYGRPGEQIHLGFTGGFGLSQTRREDAARILAEHKVAFARSLADNMLRITDPSQLVKALELLDVGETSVRRVVDYTTRALAPSTVQQSPARREPTNEDVAQSQAEVNLVEVKGSGAFKEMVVKREAERILTDSKALAEARANYAQNEERLNQLSI